jgi:hypothetical protein
VISGESTTAHFRTNPLQLLSALMEGRLPDSPELGDFELAVAGESATQLAGTAASGH